MDAMFESVVMSNSYDASVQPNMKSNAGKLELLKYSVANFSVWCTAAEQCADSTPPLCPLTYRQFTKVSHKQTAEVIVSITQLTETRMKCCLNYNNAEQKLATTMQVF